MDELCVPLEDAEAPLEQGGALEVKQGVVPAELWIEELNAEPLNGLLERADALELRLNADKTRHQIVFELLKAYASRGTLLFADGVIEMSAQGNGFLRWPRFNFRSLPQDVYVSTHFERQFSLRGGHRLCVRLRPPRDRENSCP